MKIRDLTLVSLFIALMIAGAFIRIPLPFIEVTFQAFFAVLAGLILGPKKGFLATFLYMVLGLIGLPIFAKGGGLGYILIPSFGFVIGFIVASTIVGYLYHVKKFNKYFSSILGILIIYLVGTPYMYLILNVHSNIEKTLISLIIIFIPFLIKDILLGIFGAYILKYLKL